MIEFTYPTAVDVYNKFMGYLYFVEFDKKLEKKLQQREISRNAARIPSSTRFHYQWQSDMEYVG